MSKHRTDVAKQTEEQRTARQRMALFPDGAEVLFVQKDLWVVSFQCPALVSAMVVNTHRARRAPGRKVMHPSRHTRPIPATTQWLDSISTPTSSE